MNRLTFDNTSAQRIYDDYIKRSRRALSPLDKDDSIDTLMEINSHIYEGTQRSSDLDEVTQLLDVIDKLGAPEIVLKPLVAEKKLAQASRTFNPIHVAKAIILNLRNGIVYIVFAVLYLFLFGLIFSIGAKIYDPQHVGLYSYDGRIEILGWLTDEEASGYTEVLGHWYIPVMIIITIAFYILITVALSRTRRLRRKT